MSDEEWYRYCPECLERFAAAAHFCPTCPPVPGNHPVVTFPAPEEFLFEHLVLEDQLLPAPAQAPPPGHVPVAELAEHVDAAFLVDRLEGVGIDAFVAPDTGLGGSFPVFVGPDDLARARELRDEAFEGDFGSEPPIETKEPPTADQRIVLEARRIRARGELTEADAVLARLLEARPRMEEALRERLDLALARSDRKTAIASLEGLIDRDPRDRASRLELVSLLLFDGQGGWLTPGTDVAAATEHLELLIDQNPAHAVARHRLAILRDAAGRRDEALEILEGLAEERPTFFPARVDRARLLLATGSADEGRRELASLLESLEAALEDDPESRHLPRLVRTCRSALG